MPRISSMPLSVNCALVLAASTLLTISPFAQACGKGQQQVFTCSTTNNKVVEVCSAGSDAIYSFGRVGTKPELLLRAPKTQLQYASSANSTNGSATSSSRESLKFLNGSTSYTIDYTASRGGNDSASVEVAANGKHLASVACRAGTIVARLDAIGTTAAEEPAKSKGVVASAQRGPGRIVFAKRAKPRVYDFTWNVHHPEGVKFDGPIRTSIGKLDEIEVHGSAGYVHTDGFALDGVPILGPHGRGATIGFGEILDYGDRLAILYTYLAKDACMACGSQAVVIVAKGGKVIDQLSQADLGSDEGGPNQCLYPSVKTLIDGVAVIRADKDCEGLNRVMRIGYEGIDVSTR